MTRTCAICGETRGPFTGITERYDINPDAPEEGYDWHTTWTCLAHESSVGRRANRDRELVAS